VPVYRLEVAYDGSGFRGYASQPGERTIQGELEKALSTYLKADIETAVAGRTDAGVHALGQVVSFEHHGPIDLRRLQRSVNGIVGNEVVIRAATLAEDGFNARFSARWRRYRYLMDLGPTSNPIDRNTIWHVGDRLDLRAMHSVVPAFLGEHDFSTFCRSSPGRSNVRRLTELTLAEEDTLLTVWVQANAFCHQMVRSIVGYLYDIGRGFSDAAFADEVIAAGDRGAIATIAPAHGLTLWAVGFDT
jgi:tRNA pseudouridine38-40 synthase